MWRVMLFSTSVAVVRLGRFLERNEARVELNWRYWSRIEALGL